MAELVGVGLVALVGRENIAARDLETVVEDGAVEMVGMRAGGRQAIFVMSNSFVTLHEFASFFKDHIGVAQALYFDGNASRLFAPQLGRNDPGRRMGPIIGTVVPKP